VIKGFPRGILRKPDGGCGIGLGIAIDEERGLLSNSKAGG